jgi:hypothetical protein
MLRKRLTRLKATHRDLQELRHPPRRPHFPARERMGGASPVAFVADPGADLLGLEADPAAARLRQR